jgi:homoserine dehydrogenase
MDSSKRRGRSGPTISEIFQSNDDDNIPIQTDEKLHEMAKKKGFTVEYTSDRKTTGGNFFGHFSLRDMTILALVFVLFLKMSLIPMVNVLMSGYAVDSTTSESTTGSTDGSIFKVSQQHSENTCVKRSCVGDASEFKGANIVLLGVGGVGQEIMLQLASSNHLVTNGGELNVMAVFDSKGGLSTSTNYPMTSKTLRTIVRTKRNNIKLKTSTVISLAIMAKDEKEAKEAKEEGSNSNNKRRRKNEDDPVFVHASTHYTLKSFTEDYSSIYSIPKDSMALDACTTLLLIIDATSESGEKHSESLQHVLSTIPCSRLVLANKAPISSVMMEDIADAAFRPLDSLGDRVRRVYYEATVGAALPVIKTIQSFNSVGDSVVKVEAILSGTASYVLSDVTSKMLKEMKDRNQVSEIQLHEMLLSSLMSAMKMGFTESNPCLDVEGKDVARKALILGRLISETNELVIADVEMESLSNTCTYLNKVLSITKEDQHLGSENDLERKIQEGIENDQVLRYVAIIESYGTANSKRVKVRVALKSYGKDHPFGDTGDTSSGSSKTVASPENVIVIHSSLYNEYPLVVKGPGAGAALTASAVMSDVLRCVARK